MDSASNASYMRLQDYMLPCMNKKFFGLECPGCGLQRSVLLLLDGEFVAAFKMYPAIYAILALLFFLLSNLFIKFKYAYQIKLTLLLLTVATIIISYIIKMNHFFH